MTITHIERRFAHTIFDTIFPAGAHPDLPDGIVDVGLDWYLDDLPKHFPPMSFLVFRLALVFVALTPLFTVGRPRTIHGLDPEARLVHIGRLHHARWYLVRQMVVMIKALGSIHYFSQHAVRRRVLHGTPGATVVPLRKRVAPVDVGESTERTEDPSHTVAHAGAA